MRTTLFLLVTFCIVDVSKSSAADARAGIASYTIAYASFAPENQFENATPSWLPTAAKQ